KPGPVAPTARPAQSPADGLERVLPLRSHGGSSSGGGAARLDASPTVSLPPAQAAGQRDESLRLCRGLREGGSDRHPPEAPATKSRACPLVKPVREPDAGDPHVRFDERRWETEHGRD